MRNISKLPIPAILEANALQWTQEFLDDRKDSRKRFRYRDPHIKSQLILETHSKCVYCESKIGHNTPGDVEHKEPTSHCPEKHFDWANLTIACSECNRRKNQYYDSNSPFLDPYTDDVEAELEHQGPLVAWRSGSIRAEVTVKTLELNNAARRELLMRKIEKLGEVNELRTRQQRETNETLRELIVRQLTQMMDPSSEYSGMVCAVLRRSGTVKNV